MLMRLLLLLLIVALAAPAVAMPTCHAPTPEPAATHGHQTAATSAHHTAPAQPDMPEPQGDPLCIGCVAPSTVRPPRLDTPFDTAQAPRHARATEGAPLNRFPPATPPPRRLG